MLEFHDRKHRYLINLVEEGDFDTALPILEEYWVQYPNDAAVFSLLEECYSSKKDWDAYEKLLTQVTPTNQFTYRLSRHKIKLCLGKGLPQDAIILLNTCIEAYKNAALHDDEGNYDDDFVSFDENIPELGSLFREYGFIDVFVERLTALGHSSEISGPILLARYYLYVEQNKEKSLQTIELALTSYPNDERLSYELEAYRNQLCYEKQQQARQQLSNHRATKAIGLYHTVVQEKPASVIAQEYYLSAVVCRFFPPFLWFFSKRNPICNLPPMGKGFLHAMFFFLCCFYYKDRKYEIENDVLENITWICAVLAAGRFLLFPMAIQVAAFFKWPTYHLLKRPIRFFQGMLILLAWAHVLWAYGQEPEKLSFRLFLTVAFLFNIIIMDLAKDISPIRKTAYFVFTGISLGLGMLGYFNVIPDIWMVLLLVGWLLPVLLNALINWKENIQTEQVFQASTTDDRVRSNEHYTKRIFVVAQIVLGISIMLFLAGKMVPNGWKSVHLFLTFGTLLISLVVVTLAEKNKPDLVTLCKSRPSFSLFLGILLASMCSCLYISSTCGNRLIRQGGICLYSFLGVFAFPVLAVLVHWLYRRSWEPGAGS